MMLILLPAVDVRGGRSVRLRQGRTESGTDYGSPVEAARVWVESGAGWIHLVDLDAAFGTGDNRGLLAGIVSELGNDVNVELSGGIHDDAGLEAALATGASRVNIGTEALVNPMWASKAVSRYGDRVAIGLDVQGHELVARGSGRRCGDVFETMKLLDDAGCSRYVVTDVTRDGMMSGPNTALLHEVASRTPARITASGGIGSLEDIRSVKSLSQGVQGEVSSFGTDGNVDSAIVGKSLYAGVFTLQQALAAAR